MPRVREITQAGDNAALEKIFERERSSFGDVLNTTKVLAHCPPILQAAKDFGAAIETSGLLPASLPPLVYLRVATLNGCPF